MLKSLEVFGFKSFADRTTFAFAPGITCVVGPNGSGKSNVVDAMKWLLGDQSPKSLRGKNMADVIFNGSRSRKASGFAEATLTFDNTQNILAAPYDEVRITRRLYQGGDSEYLINGETSRLKDIRDLFAGTGAATSAYSIIEQGRVGQVLQGNPSTRRLLFDEAAGISRFKSRRVDAERKLERVSQNLLRLTDIVDEVETQLNACRSRAGKAAKYREFSRQYDALHLGVIADDLRILSNRKQEVVGRAEVAGQELAESLERQSGIEAEREQLRNRYRQADENLQETESKLSTLMQQRSSLQTSLRHQYERAREVAGEAELLRKQRSELKRRVHDIEDEIRTENELCEEARQAVAKKQAEQESCAASLQELSQAIEEARQQQHEQRRLMGERQREQATAESQLKHLTSRQETILTAQKRLQQERVDLQTEIEQRQSAVSEAERVYGEAVAKHSEHKRRIDEILKRRRSLEEQLSAIVTRQAVDREQRSAWEARLGLLEDMEQRQLGLSIGVQEILQRARKSPLTPWKHVLGILVDFFECDLEHAPLIEIALNGSSQMIVVDQLAPVLEYLDRQSTQFEGRISFVELPQGKSQPYSTQHVDEEFLQTLQQSSDVIARADTLVRCEDLYRPLVERLLRNTWIVDSLNSARRFAVQAPHGTQFLTEQGDLFGHDGVIQTGTIQAEGSVVSRRSEILRIRQELTALSRHINRLDEKTDEFDALLKRLSEELANAQEWMESQTAELSELKQHLVTRKSELESVLKDQSRIDSDLESLDKQFTSVIAERESQQQELTQLAEQIAELNQNGEQLVEQVTNLRDQERQINHQHDQVKVELTKIQERLSSVELVFNRLQKDRELREAQYSEAKSRQDAALQKRSRLELQILNAQSKLAELFLIGEQLQIDAQRSRRSRSEIQVKRDRSNEQARQITEKRRAQEEVVQDLRIERRDIDTELDGLLEKLGEEYQISVPELINAGISSYEPYEAFRRGEDIQALELTISKTVSDDDQNDSDSEVEEVLKEVSAEEEASTDQTETEEVVEDEADLAAVLAQAPVWIWQSAEENFEDVRDDIDREVSRLRKKIKALGAVDPESLQGLDELENRFRHLNTQLQDLKHAQATLQDIIRKINNESRRMFVESFTAIRSQFQELFRQLFGGGEGDVIMEDDSDPLECGIEIVARPPGKELRSISLLSGGEKTMTAVGLLLAIFKSRPSPFCILDECDAALDEANIDRFANVIKQFKDKTQFIVITHRKRTMTASDRIFGVTMEEAGISKKLTVRFEDVGENGEINTSPENKAA